MFDRVGRGLTLNVAGEAVLVTFRGMRNSMASLMRELQQLSLGNSGRLLIGSIDAATPTYLRTAMLTLKTVYPALSIELHVATSDLLVELLRDGQLDIVIGRMPEPTSTANQDCLFLPIGEEAVSVVVACNHPLAGAAKAPEIPGASGLSMDFPATRQSLARNHLTGVSYPSCRFAARLVGNLGVSHHH